MYRRIAISLAVGAITYVGAMDFARPCTPAPPQLRGVYPSDGADIPHRPTFTVVGSRSTSSVRAKIRHNSGQSIPLKKGDSFRAGSLSAHRFQPEKRLPPGTYRFKAFIPTRDGVGRDAGSDDGSSITKRYRVRTDFESPEIPKPESVELATAAIERNPAACVTGDYKARIRFETPTTPDENLGYFVVTFRKTSDGGGGDVSKRMFVQPNDRPGDLITATAQLGFEPKCAIVTAYSGAATSKNSANTCERTACSDKKQKGYDIDWDALPSCDENPSSGTSGSGSSGSGTTGSGTSGSGSTGSGTSGSGTSGSGSGSSGLKWESGDGTSGNADSGCGCGQSRNEFGSVFGWLFVLFAAATLRLRR